MKKKNGITRYIYTGLALLSQSRQRQLHSGLKYAVISITRCWDLTRGSERLS